MTKGEGRTMEMTEIYFNDLRSGELKQIEVPTSRAGEEIERIKNSEILSFSAAYPIEDEWLEPDGLSIISAR